MIKSKKSLYIALVLFITSFVMNFPFAHYSKYGETRGAIFGIPIDSTNGFNYIGFTSLLILIAGLYFFSKSLKKYNARFVVLAILIVVILPPILSSLFL